MIRKRLLSGFLRIFLFAAAPGTVIGLISQGTAFSAVVDTGNPLADRLSGPGALGTTQSPRTDNKDLEPAFSGGEVRFLCDSSETERESQQLSAVIRSADGKVLVVDGGVSGDSAHLLSVIKEMGGYVDAWLITHPQPDHAGALCDILKNHPAEADIRNIYFRFLDPGFYEEADVSESGFVKVLTEELHKLPAEKLRPDIKRGDTFVLSDQLSFRVLNDPLDLKDAYAINNSGIMYDVTLAGKHIIFLGDMGPHAGDIHMESGVLEGISADYVQMSHHGQNGVSKEFYTALKPKACVWPTPEWLYNARPDNVSGFETWLTRSWIDELGVTENYCTKDGDVTIY